MRRRPASRPARAEFGHRAWASTTHAIEHVPASRGGHAIEQKRSASAARLAQRWIAATRPRPSATRSRSASAGESGASSSTSAAASAFPLAASARARPSAGLPTGRRRALRTKRGACVLVARARRRSACPRGPRSTAARTRSPAAATTRTTHRRRRLRRRPRLRARARRSARRRHVRRRRVLRRGHGGADDAGLRVLADDTGDRRVHRRAAALGARRRRDVGAQRAQRLASMRAGAHGAWGNAGIERSVLAGLLRRFP